MIILKSGKRTGEPVQSETIAHSANINLKQSHKHTCFLCRNGKGMRLSKYCRKNQKRVFICPKCEKGIKDRNMNVQDVIDSVYIRPDELNFGKKVIHYKEDQ